MPPRPRRMRPESCRPSLTSYQAATNLEERREASRHSAAPACATTPEGRSFGRIARQLSGRRFSTDDVKRAFADEGVALLGRDQAARRASPEIRGSPEI